MMETLIKNARIIWPGSAHHGQTADVLVKNGSVEAIGTLTASPDHTIDMEGATLVPGLFDMQADFADPGFEHREDLHSGALAALAGGFTGVLVMPNTQPPIDTKSAVEYITRSAAALPVAIHPAGCLSEGRNGAQISEMTDMHHSGARAFTDYKKSINNAEVMHRALDYSRNFGGLVISFPWDDTLCPGGLMHEGSVSVSLGLKGLPEVTEEIRLSRDLDILRYVGGRLHVSLISTAGSVALVRKAKKEGLNVTCGVAAHQLFFTDERLTDFDTRFKVLPPLRTQAHIDALIAGLKDGTIDVIVSDHSPKDIEAKKVEFDHASYGMSTIETAFATALTVLQDPALVIEKMAVNPRKILGLSMPELQKGEPADLMVYTKKKTNYSPETSRSKSKNSPFKGIELDGKVRLVASKGAVHRF